MHKGLNPEPGSSLGNQIHWIAIPSTHLQFPACTVRLDHCAPSAEKASTRLDASPSYFVRSLLRWLGNHAVEEDSHVGGDNLHVVGHLGLDAIRSDLLQ